MRRSSRATSPPTCAARSRGTSPRARSTSRATARPSRTRTSSCRRSPATSRTGSSRSARRSPPASQTIMTAHVRVPALDDAPATLSPRIVQGLLRDELGFDGLVLADALEMKAVERDGRRRGVGCPGARGRRRRAHHRARPRRGRRVRVVRAALVARVPEERLREAAARVARVAALGAAGPRRPDRERRRRRGAACAAASRATRRFAARAARSSSCVRPRTSPRARPSTRSRREIVREGEPVPAADVYVVRDAHRHPWMQAAADVEGAVVVETGLPLWRPSRARGYVVTLRRQPRVV